MVETVLKENTKWLDFFKGHPKKDDLADSLLMTLHYFEKPNLLNEFVNKDLFYYLDNIHKSDHT